MEKVFFPSTELRNRYILSIVPGRSLKRKKGSVEKISLKNWGGRNMNIRFFCLLTLSVLVLFLLAARSDERCSSDFDCGIGNRCVKAPLKSWGECMKETDSYGLPTFRIPQTDSIGPNMNLQGECNFDFDCSIGSYCDQKYKVCIKR